jgi:hypothetical protein
MLPDCTELLELILIWGPEDFDGSLTFLGLFLCAFCGSDNAFGRSYLGALEAQQISTKGSTTTL